MVDFFWEIVDFFSLLNWRMFDFGSSKGGVEADRGEEIGGVAGKLIWGGSVWVYRWYCHTGSPFCEHFVVVLHKSSRVVVFQFWFLNYRWNLYVFISYSSSTVVLVPNVTAQDDECRRSKDYYVRQEELRVYSKPSLCHDHLFDRIVQLHPVLR